MRSIAKLGSVLFLLASLAFLMWFPDPLSTLKVTGAAAAVKTVKVTMFEVAPTSSPKVTLVGAEQVVPGTNDAKSIIVNGAYRLKFVLHDPGNVFSTAAICPPRAGSIPWESGLIEKVIDYTNSTTPPPSGSLNIRFDKTSTDPNAPVRGANVDSWATTTNIIEGTTFEYSVSLFRYQSKTLSETLSDSTVQYRGGSIMVLKTLQGSFKSGTREQCFGTYVDFDLKVSR